MNDPLANFLIILGLVAVFVYAIRSSWRAVQDEMRDQKD